MMIDNSNFIEFNKSRLLGQNQYVSGYILGSKEKPALGKGLRFIGDVGNYHSWYIHKDDEQRFTNRFSVYQTLRALGMDDEAEKLVNKIYENPESKLSDPSHYDYLEFFYSFVCEKLNVADTYRGSWSSNGDKMYQYKDMWNKGGVPWFHGVVCYMLMDSVFYKEVRQTKTGWRDPGKWVIENYKSGHNLFKSMIENHI